MSKQMTPELKAALLTAVKASMAKSTVGSQALGNVNVGDEIQLVDIITSSTNPAVNISVDNPQYVFASNKNRTFTVSGNGIPAMRVMAAGKTAMDAASFAKLEDVRNSAAVEFFKQALDSIDPGKEIDLTAIRFKCVAKVLNPESVDNSRPAMLNTCYKRYDEYREATRGENPDFTTARIALHNSGLKPEFASKSYANAEDRRFFITTPVFEIAWNQPV